MSDTAFHITVRENWFTELAAITHQSLTCSLCTRGSESVAHVDSFRPVDKNECWHSLVSGRQIKLYFEITIFKLRIAKGYVLFYSYTKNLLLLLINVDGTNIRKINCTASVLLCWIQICFNEYRSFAVVGLELALSFNSSFSHSPGMFPIFHHTFSIHVSDAELLMVGNFKHVIKLKPDLSFPLCSLSVCYYLFSAI